MPAQTPVSIGTAYYSHNDTAPPYRRQLQQGDGSPIVLTNAALVTIILAHTRYSHYYSPNRPIVNRAVCVIESPETDGYVYWEPQPGDLSPPGIYDVIFEITWSDGSIQTVPAHTYEHIVITTKPGGFDV